MITAGDGIAVPRMLWCASLARELTRGSWRKAGSQVVEDILSGDPLLSFNQAVEILEFTVTIR